MKRTEAAFMMVEAIVMTTILAIGLIGIISAIRAGIEVVEIARESDVAERIAQAKMSEIEISPLAALGTKEGTVAMGERSYGWSTAVQQTKDPEMLSARVQVRYVVRGRERQIVLPTLLYQRSGRAG